MVESVFRYPRPDESKSQINFSIPIYPAETWGITPWLILSPGYITHLSTIATDVSPKMTSNFKSIPVIDLSLANSPLARPKLLQELHHALTCIGFLYITNHDVPQDVISDLKDALPKLFALDPAVKEEVALHNSPHFLGYSQVGSETTAGVADKREQFEFATELPDLWRAGLPLYERLKGPNQVHQPLLSPSVIWLKSYTDKK